MPRTQSAASVASLLASETGEAYLVLLTISDSTGVIARYTSDNVDTVVSTTTYTPSPFDIFLPANVEGRISTAQLSLDNVDRALIDSLRLATSAFQVDMKVVLGSDPTDTLVEFTDYTLRNVSYDAFSISGTLTLEDFLNEPVGRIMTGSVYPGLFYV